jgi:hypothetical protein
MTTQKIKVKVFVSLEIDPEEYIVPSDGMVEDDFEDAIQDLIHDIGGVKIKNIRVTQE